jgi:hypothetical protein
MMEMKDYNVFISSIGSGIGSTSLKAMGNIGKVEVKHKQTDDKDEVEVKVNGEVVFKYDSKLKGDYMMKNHIQTPIVKGELNNATITEARITTASISNTSI